MERDCYFRFEEVYERSFENNNLYNRHAVKGLGEILLGKDPLIEALEKDLEIQKLRNNIFLY